MKREQTKTTKVLRKCMIFLAWIVVWFALSFFIQNPILFAGPMETIQTLISLLKTTETYLSIGATLLGILLGFLGGSMTGMILGIISFRYSPIKEFLSPAIRLIRTAPVASFIILVLIWFGSGRTAGVIAGIVVFPFWYLAMMQGLELQDQKLLELHKVSRMSWKGRHVMITLPAVYPLLRNAAELSIGMAFRSGVAAEVIGQPLLSIGNGMYRSKVSLDTARLFAWTIITVLVAWVLERVVKWCASKLEKVLLKSRKKKGNEKPRKTLEFPRFAPASELAFQAVSKYYPSTEVLNKFDYKFKPESITILTGASGSGKTTTLRLLMGLEKPSEGEVIGLQGQPAGVVFQETRLGMNLSAVENLYLMEHGLYESRQDIRKCLAELLPEESLDQPVSELSGGMQRRVEIVRAMNSTGSVLIFDEPLTGLDEENVELAVQYILKHRQGRTLIISTHRPQVWQNRGVVINEVEMGEKYGNK